MASLATASYLSLVTSYNVHWKMVYIFFIPYFIFYLLIILLNTIETKDKQIKLQKELNKTVNLINNIGNLEYLVVNIMHRLVNL